MSEKLSVKDLERLKHFLDQGHFVTGPAERLARRFSKVFEKAQLSSLVDQADHLIDQCCTMRDVAIDDLGGQRQKKAFIQSLGDFEHNIEKCFMGCRQSLVEGKVTADTDFSILKTKLRTLFSINADTKSTQPLMNTHKDLEERQNHFYEKSSQEMGKIVSSEIDGREQLFKDAFSHISKTFRGEDIHPDILYKHKRILHNVLKMEPPSLYLDDNAKAQNHTAKEMVGYLTEKTQAVWEKQFGARNDNIPQNLSAKSMIEKLIMQKMTGGIDLNKTDVPVKPRKIF